MKKHISFFMLFTLGLTSSIDSMEGDNFIDLLQLQSTLTALAKKSNAGLMGFIGEILVDKKFNDIFSREQLKSITPKINAEDLILLKYDHSQSIYQLRTLQQYSTTCGAHAFKNCLWMINGLSEGFKKFVESYLKTVDEAVFDKYFESVSCKASKFIPFFEQINDIKQNKISYLLDDECLPKNSLTYLDQIFSFEYAPKPNPNYRSHAGEAWSKFFNFAKIKLKDIEVEANSEDIGMDAAIFSSKFGVDDIMKFYNLITKNAFCLGIDLIVDNGSMGHATCLIAHRINNKIEYLFLDSMNMFFDGQYPYLPLIKCIQGFIENSENFKKALIRRAYANVLLYAKQSPLRVFQIHLDVFLNSKFKDLNLMETELYHKFYKPHFCQIIKTYMEQDLANKNEYEEILEKMQYLIYDE